MSNPKNCIQCHGKGKSTRILDYFSGENFGYEYCKECGNTFDSNVNEIIEEFTTNLPKDTSLLDENEYKKYFVETSNITDNKNNVYTQFDWQSQDVLKSGVIKHVCKHIDMFYNKTDKMKIMDVGCADGFTTRELLRVYSRANIVALDPSPQIHNLDGLERVEPYQGVLQNYKFTPKSFDVILIIGNLMLHADPIETLATAKALLKDKGILIFDVKNPNSTIRVAARVLGSLGINVINKNSNYQRMFLNMRYGYTYSYMCKLCQHLGFEILNHYSKPPRLLEFKNRSNYTKSLSGFVWKCSDLIDNVRDERAWLQFVVRKQSAY